MIKVIRVCLSADGRAVYWSWDDKTEEYSISPLSPVKALRLMSSPRIKVEVAWCNPADKQTHNWEFAGKPKRI